MTAKRPMRRPIVDVTDLSNECRQQLLDGCSFFGEGYGDGTPDAAMLEQMGADWQAYRDELLADWATNHPGTRPWAFWQFDATERRKVTSGRHPFDDPQRRITCADWHARYPHLNYRQRFWDLYFGTPAMSFGEKVTYESESQYLTRLDLLLPGEAERIHHD